MRHEAHLISRDGTSLWHGWNHLDTCPLVLCDGIGCDGFAWPYLMDHFADRCALFRWHYRGHGYSQRPACDDALSLDHFSHDLNDLLQARGISRAVLLGHSFGVQVILNYYHLYPDTVAALIPISGAFEYPLDTFHGTHLYRLIFQMMIDWVKGAPDTIGPLWRKITPSPLTWLYAQVAEVDPKRVHRVDFQPYLEHLAHVEPDLFFRVLEQAAQHSARAWLPEIDIPTLIVTGTEDRFTPARCSQEMHQLIPDSHYLCIEGATHALPIEHPDTLNAAIESFLRAHLPDVITPA